uniref:Uncharacterized protein n=1 Tax=Fagus sylvatica TaxID=28930 RepID=A0A2N9I0P3_FAGSY
MATFLGKAPGSSTGFSGLRPGFKIEKALQGEILCEKLKACGFGQLRSSPAGAAVFNDISSPASIHEKKVALEFLVVPDLPQLPPFFLRRPSYRSISGHRKCSEMLLLWVPYFLFLFYLHYMSIAASGMAVSDSSCELHDDRALSLADDREDMTMSFKDEKFDNLIFKVPEKKHVPNGTVETVGPELFDDLCLTELRFDASFKKFGPNELKYYNDLKEPMVQMAR